MRKKFKMLWLLLLLPCLFACGAEETSASADVRMLASVVAVGEKIEVTVIEGDYGASGPYLVITGDATAYRDSEGNAIGRGDLKAGDEVEIYYGGQVMMSYPPQIVAARIIKK